MVPSTRPARQRRDRGAGRTRSKRRIDASPRAGRQANVVALSSASSAAGNDANKVVTTLARTFASLGAIAVRFNFRGVGASTGAYADGIGERDDTVAVARWSCAQWPDLRLYLGGFSFGAAVALAACGEPEPRGLVTVAPALSELPPISGGRNVLGCSYKATRTTSSTRARDRVGESLARATDARACSMAWATSFTAGYPSSGASRRVLCAALRRTTAAPDVEIDFRAIEQGLQRAGRSIRRDPGSRAADCDGVAVDRGCAGGLPAKSHRGRR